MAGPRAPTMAKWVMKFYEDTDNHTQWASHFTKSPKYFPVQSSVERNACNFNQKYITDWQYKQYIRPQGPVSTALFIMVFFSFCLLYHLRCHSIMPTNQHYKMKFERKQRTCKPMTKKNTRCFVRGHVMTMASPQGQWGQSTRWSVHNKAWLTNVQIAICLMALLLRHAGKAVCIGFGTSS